jgi:hypothetical protein
MRSTRPGKSLLVVLKSMRCPGMINGSLSTTQVHSERSWSWRMIAASVALRSGPLTTPSVLAMVVLPNPDLAARLRRQNLLPRPPRLLPLHKVLGRPPLKPRGLLHRMCLALRKVAQLHRPRLRLRLSLPPLPLLLRQYHLVIRSHRAHLKHPPVALLHHHGLPPRHLDHL